MNARDRAAAILEVATHQTLYPQERALVLQEAQTLLLQHIAEQMDASLDLMRQELNRRDREDLVVLAGSGGV
jgi:hypothetical protein